MFTLPMESVGMAMTTYTGQNYGAGKMDRIKSGIRSGLTIQAILSGVGELAGRSLRYMVKKMIEQQEKQMAGK